MAAAAGFSGSTSTAAVVVLRSSAMDGFWLDSCTVVVVVAATTNRGRNLRILKENIWNGQENKGILRPWLLFGGCFGSWEMLFRCGGRFFDVPPRTEASFLLWVLVPPCRFDGDEASWIVPWSILLHQRMEWK